MANKLKRVTNKIFGSTASTTGAPETGAEIGQFGSAKAGTYNATADVETIQALPAYEQGWIGAVIPDQQYPTLPEMTGVNKVLSYQTGYIFQEGIPEWDNGTTYFKNSFVKYAPVDITYNLTSSIGSSTGITGVTVSEEVFISQISVAGTYIFSYNGTSWLYNDIVTDLTIYGIIVEGTPVEGDAVTITLVVNENIGDASIYVSTINNNIGNNPQTDVVNWTLFSNGGSGGGWKPSLFQTFWSDHLLNRVDMLRSDTFSWQSGEVYKACYDLLVSEYSTTSNTVTVDDVTFKITSNGYRIADATQEQAIMNLYDNTGVAWYYILDTTNTRFKLPRMKYLASVKGAAQAPVMPYDSEQATLKASDYASKLTYFAHVDGQANGTILRNNPQGALVIPLNQTQTPSPLGASFGGNYGTWGGTFTPMMYADLANTVTPQTLDNMYLYFYVGEYTQTAVEQTAGLNAELFNGKMDKDLSNRTSNIHFVIETSDKSILPSWYRIYDNGWCEQGGYSFPATSNITFLKPFKDINFTVITQSTDKMATSGKGTYQENYNYTTHGFGTNVNVNTAGYVWQASGYIK